jgi:hypothetical protein
MQPIATPAVGSHTPERRSRLLEASAPDLMMAPLCGHTASVELPHCGIVLDGPYVRLCCSGARRQTQGPRFTGHAGDRLGQLPHLASRPLTIVRSVRKIR